MDDYSVNKNKKIRKKGKSLLEFPKEYIVFDLETTGMKSSDSEIIEIAALKVLDGKIIDKFDELVKPSKAISRTITNLTGITNSMVKDKNTILTVGKAFDSFVKDSILVAHNANFDVNFMYDNFEKYKIGKFDNDFVDTLRLSRQLIKDSANHKLQTLISYFNFDDIGAHRAMADTFNTHKLFLELKDLYKENPDAFYPKRKVFQRLNLHEIKSQRTLEDINQTSPFYNRNICFTGIMNSFTKQEVGQMIANLGGILQNNVTMNTHVLILGDVEKQIEMYGSKSRKHKQVLDLQEKGKDILIFEEDDLVKLINNK